MDITIYYKDFLEDIGIKHKMIKFASSLYQDAWIPLLFIVCNSNFVLGGCIDCRAASYVFFIF